MIIRAFAQVKEQEAALKAHGIPAKDIWLDGRGAEDFEACLRSFRGRPGALVIAHDLRALGTSKAHLSRVMDRLEQAKIKVRDISHPQDKTHAAMIQRANVAISGARYYGDKRKARRMGAHGGVAKGRAAAQARAGIIPDRFVDLIVDETRIEWKVKLAILPGFTEPTLRRWYGRKNKKKRAAQNA